MGKGERERERPWSNQNHKSSNVELGFHPTKYSQVSDHGDTLASKINAANVIKLIL